MKYASRACAAAIGLSACALSSVVFAADHRDGPAAVAAPDTDINDVYAWMSSDASKVYLAMTVFPAATAASKFSNAAKYVFHLNSSAGYGMAQMETRIVCTFSGAATQTASCWVVRGGTTLDYVTGEASAAAGITSASGKVKLFAGLRDDPFFFNLDGFNATATAVGMAAGGLVRDAAGCPMLDANTATTLVTQLMRAPGGGAATDFFLPLNTLAIVISIDKSLVTPGGAFLGVWGSTNM